MQSEKITQNQLTIKNHASRCDLKHTKNGYYLIQIKV
jgi:hypothetical protein